MLLPLAAVLVGSLIGFVGSRKLRRPQATAQAASVARSVGGNLGRRKGLTPPELQRACFSEMVRHVRVDRAGRTQAPTRYRILLHPDDLAQVEESKGWFVDGLTDALRQAASENGWILDGKVEIAFEADPARRPGVPSALAVNPEGPKRSQPTSPPAPTPSSRRRATALVLRRTDTGERTPLGAAAITIGRASASDITVDDKRVSRTHARIAPSDGGWTVVDAGSSNGTTLDGRRVPVDEPRRLAAGQVIGVGPVELVVEAGGPMPEPGTRALDDRDRTRISGEVLPPNRGEDR